jgi:oligopeptide transport system ATP-binding protein
MLQSSRLEPECVMALLEIENLRVYFHTRAGVVRAVDGVSYAVEKGETLGIVGESGSGKSVSQYAQLGLLPMPPGRIEGGRAVFDGQDLLTLAPRALRKVRGRRISMIFQDPMTALNPYMKVGAQVMEPLLVHGICGRKEARTRAIEALEAVGIQDAAGRLDVYPHAFSGGMRQRVMIAMALITRPELLIADEPTTALDVTVQAQVLDLIKARQRELGMAVLLITHDLGIVANTCDRVLVMYAGRVVESAPVRALFRETRHPYTKALMASLPAMHKHGEPLYSIPGQPPDLSREVTGCPFAPRCAHADARCMAGPVSLQEIAPTHGTACARIQRGEITL